MGDRDSDHRRLSFKGEAASLWFAERGWDVCSRDRTDTLRVLVEELRTDSIALRRIWHTPATLTARVPTSTSQSAVSNLPLIILHDDGPLTVSVATGESVALESGGTALLLPGGSATLDAVASTARVEIRARIRLAATAGAVPSLSWSSDPTLSRHVVAAAANVLLRAGTRTENPEFPRLQSGVEHLVSALAAELCLPSGRQSAPALLRERADRVIFDHAHDPAFTVNELARRLNVSRSYLTRVYGEIGVSPGERIRHLRLELAGDEGGRDLIPHTASRSGLRSVRTLGRARRDLPDGET